jgi:hypothetical protein
LSAFQVASSGKVKSIAPSVPNKLPWPTGGVFSRRSRPLISVSVISDHDEAQDETCVVLHGGAVVRVPCSLDEALAWFA